MEGMQHAGDLGDSEVDPSIALPATAARPPAPSLLCSLGQHPPSLHLSFPGCSLGVRTPFSGHQGSRCKE